MNENDSNEWDCGKSDDGMEDDSCDMSSKRMKTGLESSKNLISRSYVINDNGAYERIIRKRKRKSSD